MKKSYCIFSAQYLPHMGGVERYTYNLAKKLVEKGHDVTVVTSNVDHVAACETMDGIMVYRVPCWNLLNGRYPVLKMNSQFWKIHRIISEKKYDMVIVNTRFYVHSLYGILFARKIHGKGIVIEHGTGHMTLHNHFLDLVENIVEHSITAVERLVCKEFYGVSEACLEWLQHFHIRGNGTLYNAIDLECVEEQLKNPVCSFRKQFHIPEEAVVVAFTGRLLKEKGILTLIQAVKNLNKKYPNLYLLIAGDGEEKNVVYHERTENIIPLGRLTANEVIALLKETDIFCLPTEYPEGFPTSTLEALACKCYPIVTDKGSAYELIPDASYGTVIESGNPKVLQQALEIAMQNPESRGKAVKRSYERLQKNFTWDIVAENVIDLT